MSRILPRAKTKTGGPQTKVSIEETSPLGFSSWIGTDNSGSGGIPGTHGGFWLCSPGRPDTARGRLTPTVMDDRR